MEKIKEILRQTVNIIIGSVTLAFIFSLLAFISGIAVRGIIKCFQLGYNLW